MHKCIFEIFESTDYSIQNFKKQLFENIFFISLQIKPQLIILLLNYEIYNTTDRYDARDFKYFIQRLIDLEKFAELDSNLIFKICEIILRKIQNSVTKKQASGILEITNSTMRELIQMMKMLKTFVDKIINYKNLNKTQINEFIILNKEIQEFINKNPDLGFTNYFYA